MNANDMTNEEISAFADGELPAQRVEMLAQTLRQPEGRTCWDAYHQIGDVLRSDDMAIAFSSDFTARMSARLDAEPVFISPSVGPKTDRTAGGAAVVPTHGGFRASARRRLIVPGLVAAAAAVAYIGFPQLMVASNGYSGKSPVQTVSIPAAGLRRVAGTDVVQTAVPNVASATQVVVLRDPRIDEYLLAHQRFSPSVYSSAQFARSATFASDSNK